MPSPLRFVVLLLVAPLFVGCSKGDASASASKSPAGPVVAVPCFPDDGPLAFEIAGVPVARRTVERLAAEYRLQNPGASELTATRFVVENAVIRVAAAYSAYRDRIPALSARAAEVAKHLADGEDFAAVARRESDDPATRAAGGKMPALARGQSGLPLAVEAVVFAAPVGSVTSPIASDNGLLIFKIEKENPGPEPRLNAREFSKIHLHPEAELARLVRSGELETEAGVAAARAVLSAYERSVVLATNAAKVKILDAATTEWVYPRRRDG